MPMKLPLGLRYITFLRRIPAVLLLCFLFIICISESFTYLFIVAVVLDFAGQEKTDGYANLLRS